MPAENLPVYGDLPGMILYHPPNPKSVLLYLPIKPREAIRTTASLIGKHFPEADFHLMPESVIESSLAPQASMQR